MSVGIAELLTLVRLQYGAPTHSDGSDLQVWHFRHDGEKCFLVCLFECSITFSSQSDGFSVDDYSEPSPEMERLKESLEEACLRNEYQEIEDNRWYEAQVL